MTDARRQWVAMLAKLTSPMDPPTATAALTDMLPMFADLPDQAFTIASLEDVAAKSKRVPTYGELRERLGGWWREHRPASGPALEPPPTDHYERYNIPPPRTPPTEAELAAVGEIVAAFRMESAARQVSAAISAAKPARPPRALTDAELLAVWQKAAPDGARTKALAEKVRAAGVAVPA